MPDTNRWGLTRVIPTAIKRAVRQRCGFGCVVCGNAIVDYDHFAPEFKDARRHEVDGIILLCPLHHRGKGAFVSTETIARAAVDPYCKKEGRAWTKLDLKDCTVGIGPFFSRGCPIILELLGMRMIWFSPPEQLGGPLRLNLRLYDRGGKKLVFIEDNVWSASPTASDIVLVAGGACGSIRVDFNGTTIFSMVITPPNDLQVKCFRGYAGMKYYELTREDGEGELSIQGKSFGKSNVFIREGGTVACL